MEPDLQIWRISWFKTNCQQFSRPSLRQHSTKLVLKRLIQHFFFKSLFQSIVSMHFQRIVEFNKIWKKKIISSIWNGSDESVFFKRLLIILLIFKWGCFRSFWFVLDNVRSFLEQKITTLRTPPPCWHWGLCKEF